MILLSIPNVVLVNKKLIATSLTYLSSSTFASHLEVKLQASLKCT